MRTWRDGFWTRSERTVVAGILVVLLGILSYRYATRTTYLPNPLPPEGSRAHEIVSTLDPNTATWEQLALLPNIGEKRARTIVDYRTQYLADHPGDVAFKTLDDLTDIPGIGEATAENLAPYLSLPTEPDR